MAIEHEVYAVRFGTLETTRSGTFYRYGVYGEADAPLQMDYFFWVIRTADEVILLDSGFHPDAARRRGRTVTIEPVAALAGIGITPEEVSKVVVSHFHYDHVGNLPAFPKARLIAQRAELEFWTGTYGSRVQFNLTTEANEIEYLARCWREERIDVLDGDRQIAPGVEARLLGGHCPGQMVLCVDTEAGPVVLASDALHMYEEMERDMPFEIFSDLPDTYRAYDTLRELERAGAAIVAGHDPLVMARFSPASQSAAAFAVRVG